ncbi:RAB6A-GEF complex partner protein 1-like isoform X2 [Asterias rubens]|uniref:RAB6A-GEF complex partner protein 1-like isoform X2 n=1 Tax=Asterias rubens TaxID=7604 RepID=UPI001455948F|nr:RAB6A-GEF complex partner protein 1-like isoform X2 [Asterias rubens]
MYFPVGWPKYLDVPSAKSEAIQEVLASPNRSIFVVTTSQSIHIWQSKPCVLIVTFRRSDDSVIVHGTNLCAEWKPDCTVLAVGTSGGHLLLFEVQQEGTHHLFTTKQSSSAHYRCDTTEADNNTVPMLKIDYAHTMQITAGINSLCCLKDDLLVATSNGLLMRVGWDGSTRHMMDISIRAIPFSIDLQQSRESLLGDTSLSFKQTQYSMILSGLAVVLSDGRAAFLTADNSKFEPRAVHAVWAPDVKTACCVAINHKYRLIVFGLANGQGVVYTLDEVTGALQLSHWLTLSSSDFPDGCQAAGPISTVTWTPDGCALACAWKQGGLALWSVFGALLMCTFSGDYGLCPETSRPYPLHVHSMDWDPEGYNLWITTSPKSSKDKKRISDSGIPFPRVLQSADQSTGELVLVSFVKSALTTNPCMTNHEHLFLQGEDRLYLNTGDTILKTAQPDVMLDSSTVVSVTSQGNTSDDSIVSSVLIGNKQWQVMSLPYNYMASNWPLRYAAVDRSGHCVAIAGRYGLAHCTIFAKRWKLFGNVTQEKDMSVSGGITWWKDFIVMSCYNHYENRHELRLYPRISNLDNSFACITKVPYQVLVLNVFKDLLVVFCVDYHISLYSIERRDNSANPIATISRIQDLSLANFVPHPTSLVSLTLTSLRSETVSPEIANHTKEAESLITNVAGRLLMLQRDRLKPPSVTNAPLDKRKHNEMPFIAPVVLASSVENMWTTSRSNRDKPHLMEALWLGCGAAGMKVWLPLFPQKNSKHHHSFLSKRIMLPFQLRIYPLAVLFEDAVVLGAATDTLSYEPQTPSAADNKPTILPFSTLERTTQIYLHHILRQLLRRNLGIHALQIARSCISLPYFPHVLELMLHSVLEEEATASEPIPDALLPRVVAFIEEFPQFLQTIVHCARKTEIALWPYLFRTIGSPEELFEQCIKTGALQTAASYLLILQNLEPPKVSRHHATHLLDAALEHYEWKLCRDLLRFLRSISASDFEVSRTPPPSLNNSMAFPLGSPAPLPAKEGQTNHKRGRHSSKGGRAPSVVNDKQEVGPEKSRSSSLSKTIEQITTAEEYFVDSILNRHARKLLASMRLRDLGLYAADLDFKLQPWLTKERNRVAKVDDFEAALKKLHHDFQWPLPTLTTGAASIGINANKSPSLLVKSSPPSSSSIQAQMNGLKMSGGDSESERVTFPVAPLPLNRDLRVLIRPNSLASDSTHSEVRTEEAILRYPSARGSDDNSICTTEPSEGSSLFGDGDNVLEDSIWSSNANLEELEQFYLQLSHSGPRQSDKELRYLYDIFLAALCLEWTLLIAILLRDLTLISKVVNVASSSDVALEVVARMREGLSFLEMWADSECPGYKPLFVAIRPQAQVLAEVVETAITPPQTPHSRTSSTSDQSVGHQEIKRLGSHGSGVISEHELSEEDVFEDEKGKDGEEQGCSVS